MLRRFIALLISLVFGLSAVACSSPTQAAADFSNNATAATRSAQISAGKYPVQQATYDDATGEYSLMLLNTPSGMPPVFQTADLQLARLSDEQIAAGEETYLEINGDRAIMYLSEDFKIEYIHNVTDTRVDPQTGQPETVIVERRSGFWSPFAGALAGQALGSLLFTPHYYVPPIYQPGGVITGYGGYGRTYSQAVNRYQSRYQAPPPAVKNRQTLRTTGRLRNPASSTTSTRIKNRSTGSGYGSSTLRSSGQYQKKRSSQRFGSSYSNNNRRPKRSVSTFGSRSSRSFGAKSFKRRR